MFIKYIKFAFLPIVLFALLVPAVSHAVDQRCWTKLACVSAAGSPDAFHQSTETVDACKMANDQNQQPVGFCLAAGTAETKVDFGGKQSFVNFGEFIKWIYKYGVVVAGILAVVMIIVAGFSWATSGGSPEKITASKKRIGGAMMGLFLAVMSYFILSLINPYLVNLRMPQVWMINTSGLSPAYCDQITNGKKVSTEKGGPFVTDPAIAACGVDYYVEGTNDLTCKGVYCNGRSACVPSVDNFKKSASVCSDKYLSIYYKASPSVQTTFSGIFGTAEALLSFTVEQPAWLDQHPSATALVVMCNSAENTIYVDKFVNFQDAAWEWNSITKDQNGNDLKYNEYLLKYNFTSIQEANSGAYKCTGGDQDKPIGFFIKNEVELDISAHDLNVYLSLVPRDKRLLTASRYGGGGWLIPFGIFKDKNHFFELDVTGEMLKNAAKDADSSPVVGKDAKGATAFTFGWKDIQDFWVDLLF